MERQDEDVSDLTSSVFEANNKNTVWDWPHSIHWRVLLWTPALDCTRMYAEEKVYIMYHQ